MMKKVENFSSIDSWFDLISFLKYLTVPCGVLN